MKTYNAEQAAAILFVHENRILEWAAAGELAGVKLGRAWVFRERDLEDFLDRKIREQHMSVAAVRSRRIHGTLATA